MDYNELFRNKTKSLAIAVINAFSSLTYTDSTSVIRKQIIRSSTSVASNYRAMSRARSDKERYAKLSIVIEEADETLFWLELCESIHLLPIETILDLKTQAEEILKATAVYRKKLSLK